MLSAVSWRSHEPQIYSPGGAVIGGLVKGIAEPFTGDTQRTHQINTPQWYSQLFPQYAQARDLGQNAFAPGGQLPAYGPQYDLQVAGFTPNQLQAMQGIYGQVGGAQNLAGLGGGNLAATLSGQFLDPSSNPNLQGTFEHAARGVTDQYRDVTAPSLMARAQRAGAFGGFAYDQNAAMQRYNLGENLAGLASDIFGGNYQQERGRQMQALGMLPQTLQAQFAPQQEALGVGSMEQQQQQLQNQVAQQNALQQAMWNPQFAMQYAQFLRQLDPGATQTQYTKQKAEPFYNT